MAERRKSIGELSAGGSADGYPDSRNFAVDALLSEYVPRLDIVCIGRANVACGLRSPEPSFLCARPDGGASSSYTFPDQPQLLLNAVPSTIPPEFRDLAKQIGSLVESGDIARAMELSRRICDTARNYNRLYEKGGHNFMKQSESPDAIMSYILDQISTQPKFREFLSTHNRFLEFGCGVGNDAKQLSDKFPGEVIGYHAVDACEKAVRITDERLGALKAHSHNLSPLFGHSIEHDDFIEWLARAKNYEMDLPPEERLIIHSKSTLHYSLEPIFRKMILPRLLRLAQRGKGLLSLSMKTPESSTWQEHEPIFHDHKEANQDGYLCGIHPTEGQLRAFVTQDKLIRMLDEAGFDVGEIDEKGELKRGTAGNIIISKNASVQRIEEPGYDFDGRTEVFTTVLARPKSLLIL
jgi:SAM-dependent methyltransferase